MSDAPTSLRHPESSQADDALAQEARSHVANSPALQLMAELILKLRTSRFSWWTPESLRGTWDSKTRMSWFEQRPDIRQRITCTLTGLAPKASRNKQPDFQAALIDSVVDDGDVTADQFEGAFEPIELAAYAPVADLWHKFRERMPWDQDTSQHQELVGWLLDQLLASSSSIEGMTRKPILTSHAVRTTIPGKLWHSKIPLEVRVAIDDLRFQRERAKPGEPFHAIHDLSVATPTIIAANIPLRELLRVLDVAEKAMGLPSARNMPNTAPPPKADEAKAAEPPKEAAKPVPAAPPPPAPPGVLVETKAAAPAQAAPVAADKPAEKKPEEKKPEEKKVEAAPKSVIERMADKVLEKVSGKDAPKAEPPKTETPKAPPASITMAAVKPGAGAAAAAPPPPPPGTALPAPPGGEPITARGPKSESDIAPLSENGEDIVVETDDSFKFDDDDEGTGIGTKDDPRVLSKKPETPPTPPLPVPKR